MCTDALTAQVCVAFVGVFYTWCCLFSLCCGSPLYPMGPLGIWVLSNSAQLPHGLPVCYAIVSLFITSPSSTEVSAPETTLSSLTRIQQKQKEIQIHFWELQFCHVPPPLPPELDQTISNVMSIQTGMTRCASSLAVSRKITPAWKLCLFPYSEAEPWLMCPKRFKVLSH